MSKIEAKENTLSKLDSIIHTIQDGQIEYSLADCLDDLTELSDELEALTSELEAERKAKEEAIRLLSTTVDSDDNGVVVIDEVAINNFLKTHTVSKGEK